MQMENNITVTTPYKYFSASNGNSGFVNYFEETFSRDKYRKVYILKGGPGTGKSTLMKKLCGFASERGVYNEAIYCSSDVKSLDGVIISNGKESVSVFDGTAPHTSDPVLPGAVDVILNLGLAWDESGLEKRKDDIAAISKDSSEAYAEAYGYLAKIQNIDNKIAAESSAYKEAEKILKSLPLKTPRGIESTRLVSAFTNTGLFHIDTLSDISDEYYTLDGNMEYKNVVLHRLAAMLSERGIEFIKFPFALDTNILEAVYLPGIKTAISALGISSSEMKTETLMRKYGFSEAYIAENGSFLESAAKALERASLLHFELEDIYTPLIDFNYLDGVYETLSAKIGNILQI